MPRKPRKDMTPEELKAIREADRERMQRRRGTEKTTKRARRVVERMQTPSGAKSAQAAKPPASVQETREDVSMPQKPAFSAPAISPRIYIRAGHLAGRLEAVFESEGAVVLAKEDDAREWLSGSPVAQSIVGELLTTAGYLEEYQAWASLG